MIKIIIHIKKILSIALLIFGMLLNCPQLLSQVKYIINCRQDLLEASLDTALSQIGTTERSGKNDGDIEKYQTSAGLAKGSAYCAAGQYYCFFKAAIALSIDKKDIPIPRTGVANIMYNDAARKGIKSPYKASKHDLIVWKKALSMSGHIERIFKAEKFGWVRTIAFNTSSKNKYGKKTEGVFIKQRNIYHPLGRMAIRGIIGFVTY